MAQQQKSSIELNNSLLKGHVESIRAGESKYRNPICPPGKVRHQSHAKFIAKKKRAKQQLIDRENEDLKTNLSNITSSYSAIFSAAQPTPPPGPKGQRHKSSPRPANKSGRGPNSSSSSSSVAAASVAVAAPVAAVAAPDGRDDSMRCGIMKISGRFVEARVSVAPRSPDREEGGIYVEVYDLMLKETFKLTLSSADEIPEFDSFLSAVSAARAVGGSADTDVLELLSRLTFVEEPGGTMVLSMAGTSARAAGDDMEKSEADIIAAARSVVQQKGAHTYSIQMKQDQQEQERALSPITLPSGGAASDDLAALKEAIDRMSAESAAREAELELLRQENKELRHSVKPWEPTLNPSIPPRAVIITKSPRGSSSSSNNDDDGSRRSPRRSPGRTPAS